MNKESERKRAWKLKNKEREKQNNKRWYELNKEKVSNRKADYYFNNQEQEKLRSKLFREAFPEKRRLKTPTAKISANIRSKISKLVSGRQIKSHSTQYLCCSFEELKQHLESKFKPGMTWENYGKYGWHIDHIKPLSSFDLSVESNLHSAWHFSNLQPLWAIDNLRKGKKFDSQIKTP